MDTPERRLPCHSWRRHPSVVLLAALLALAWLTPAHAQTVVAPPWRVALAPPPTEANITVGTTPLSVQLAVSPSQQTLGLGYRNGLAPGTGMLFVSDAPRVQTFWMMGMRFCLDIVWVSGTEIVGAVENACPGTQTAGVRIVGPTPQASPAPAATAIVSLPTYSSPEPVQYVLEVPAGWLAARGYGPGTPVNLSAVPWAVPATPVASPDAPLR